MFGVNNITIRATAHMHSQLHGGSAVDQEFYVVNGAEGALLGFPAIQAFNLVKVIYM